MQLTLSNNNTPLIPASNATINLRSSQPLAISLAREEIQSGKNRLVICAPCGFGKSIVACKYIENAVLKDKKVWFLVDRQNLVNQMSDHLTHYGIEHGVTMAGHERWDSSKRCQVVSIQTAEKRGWDMGIDLLLVDEGHALMRKSFVDFVKLSPNTRIISFTATPFHKDMGKIYESVINPTTTNKQISEGHLVPLRIFQCVEADMTGAKTVGGEWSDLEVSTRGRQIIGDIVTNWHQKTMEVFGKPVKTIIFPSTIAHGEEIAAAFKSMGFNFKVVCCKDNSEEKTAIINDFKKQDSIYHGLISCGVLTRGFDVTDIQIGIMARPFRKSFSEFIQQIGRVQRSHKWEDGKIKEFGLLLDHAGNVARFKDEMVDLFENGVNNLQDPADAKPPRKEPSKQEKEDMFCPICKCLWDFKGNVCTCGYERKRKNIIENVPGKMEEVFLGGGKATKKHTVIDKQQFYSEAVEYAKRKGYDIGWAAHQYKDRYGVWPRCLSTELAIVSLDNIHAWLKHLSIKKAKSHG